MNFSIHLGTSYDHNNPDIDFQYNTFLLGRLEFSYLRTYGTRETSKTRESVVAGSSLWIFVQASYDDFGDQLKNLKNLTKQIFQDLAHLR